jgi:site-specific recombinase XerD
MTAGVNFLPNVNELSLEPSRRLTDAQFQGLAELPPEVEWFANIRNPRTRRAYQTDVQEFVAYVGILYPEEFRNVARAHVIAWRNALEERRLAASTIRRKLSALSSLFEHLCECNAVSYNPVDGVTRPGEGANEGSTPAIGDAQARALLESPDPYSLKGKRDRAILSVFLYHGIRCEELCRLTVRDIQERRGVKHLRIHGKRDKIRFIPAHPGALERIVDYLDVAGHGEILDGPLFRPVKNPNGSLDKPLTGAAVYACIIKKYAKAAQIEVAGFCVHSLRATAATNALENNADIAKVQDWLGHSSISTTKLYDKRTSRPEDSPTFKVAY